jgi:hypothetical protein
MSSNSSAAQQVLAAWGGQAVACGGTSGNEACANSMAIISRGRAALCMWLPAGAVDGAVAEPGTYCACTEYRIGADCATIEAGAFGLASQYVLLLVPIYVWLIWRAERALQDIRVTNKVGDGCPQRVTRLVQLTAGFTILAFMCYMMLLVSPLPYADLTRAYDLLTATAVGCTVGADAVLLLMFHCATEQRAASVWERRAADFSMLATTASLVAAPTATSKQVVVMLSAAWTTLASIWVGRKLRRELKSVIESLDSSIGVTSWANDRLTAASNRIQRFLNKGAIFLGVQLFIRIVYASTSVSGLAPVQERPFPYVIRKVLHVVNYLSHAYILSEMVVYIGGPARAHRLSTTRVADSQYQSSNHSSRSLSVTKKDLPAPVAATPSQTANATTSSLAPAATTRTSSLSFVALSASDAARELGTDPPAPLSLSK